MAYLRLDRDLEHRLDWGGAPHSALTAPGIGVTGPGREKTGGKKGVPLHIFPKKPAGTPCVGGRRFAVGDWWMVAVGGGWRWLVVGDWWLMAVGSG